MVVKKNLETLNNMLRQYLDEADERDIIWIMRWHKVKKKSALFSLSEKRLQKVVSDLNGLILGRNIRENR